MTVGMTFFQAQSPFAPSGPDCKHGASVELAPAIVTPEAGYERP